MQWIDPFRRTHCCETGVVKIITSLGSGSSKLQTSSWSQYVGINWERRSVKMKHQHARRRLSADTGKELEAQRFLENAWQVHQQGMLRVLLLLLAFVAVQ